MKFPNRHIAAAIAALATCVAAGPGDGQPQQAAFACTNPASGTTWTIDVDYARSTVDGNAASISDSEIAWRDAKDNWHYTLDRKTGQLTAIVASSTGGNTWYDHCRPR